MKYGIYNPHFTTSCRRSNYNQTTMNSSDETPIWTILTCELAFFGFFGGGALGFIRVWEHRKKHGNVGALDIAAVAFLSAVLFACCGYCLGGLIYYIGWIVINVLVVPTFQSLCTGVIMVWAGISHAGITSAMLLAAAISCAVPIAWSVVKLLHATPSGIWNIE